MSRRIHLDARSLLFTNDSDDSGEDFVSFPTLTDPDTVANRSISTMITKTLRKVTNNASNLVHTYAAPRHATEPPMEAMDAQPTYAPEPRISSDIAGFDAETAPEANPEPNFSQTAPLAAELHNAGPARTSTALSNVLAVHTTLSSRSLAQLAPGPGLDASFDPHPPPAALKAGSTAKTAVPALETSLLLNHVQSAETTRMDSAERGPTVTSDNRSLRISTMQPSKPPSSMVSQKEVTVVNRDTAPADQAQLDTQQDDSAVTKVIHLQVSNSGARDSRTTLQNKISSIFNNLPNDIELSDDSASDLETINNDSMSSLNNSNSPSLRNRILPTITKSRYVSSPAMTSTSVASKMSELPTMSTFYSLKSKAPITRKISSNFSLAIIDGAKSIINTNLAGVASSTTSMVESITDKKKRKRIKKPRKLSDNPLKNGGIPKKYWMNDSFVSECLNCFKSFNAFRRKHHCRFCGQIFCSECTMFISYSQYKQQRKAKDGAIINDSRTYNDKLRVCKPCYSDVIVYLSDDSLDSSGNEEESGSKYFDEARSYTGADDNGLPEHHLSRYRSHSTNSRRGSAVYDLPLQNGSKSHSTKGIRESPTLAASSPAVENTQRSPEGLTYKHAPQMAIPTTRAGESVEIQVAAQKPPFNSLPLKSNFAILAMKNSVNPNLHPTAAGGEMGESSSGSWYNTYALHNVSASDLGTSQSFDNMGVLYKAVVDSRFGRLASNSDTRALETEDNEQDDDIESENEDEQVMSLYTSLNHSAANQSSLSPRPHNSLNVSIATVPTLREFPTMVTDDKYIPTNFSQRSDVKGFEFKPMDTFHNSTINENKLRSDFRSNERAKASLRRIRYRRTNKLGRKNTQGAPHLRPIETSLANGGGNGTSPMSSPTSPTPKIQSSYFSSMSVPQRSTSNPGVPTRSQHLHASLFRPNSNEDVKDSTNVLNLSLDEHVIEKGHVNDSTFNDYFSSFETSLDNSFDQHLQRMISQCLEDCDINDPTEQGRWLKVLHLILLTVNQIKIGDTLDVRQYVKIKKILGGRIDDSSVIGGLIMTKNIDSKKMRFEIDNPKIALLMFPIEYLKQKEQFISLRIVNSQQAVYITNLVSRLISLEPDIIVVGDTVCGLAEQLLEEANITVLSNVKPQVIERISRYTKGDIFQSVNDLFFKKGTLGTCERFEVKRFLYKDIVKTYSFFKGTKIESGFTICLRGGDEELLSSAKYATESLVLGVLNSRFEKGLFKDMSLIIENAALNITKDLLGDLNQCMHENTCDTKQPCIQSLCHLGVSDYITLFEKRVLSDSPAVHFTLPKPLSNLVSAFKAYLEFCDFNKQMQLLQPDDEIEPGWLAKLDFDFNLERFGGKQNIIKILKFVSDDRAKRLVNEFSFRTRLWSNSMKYPIYQLYPIFHKSIHFLHSTVSMKHATPCFGPIVVVIDYYTDNDKCLGVLFEQIIQESYKVCGECGELMLDHYRTYAHDNAKLDMIVEKVDHIADGDESRGMEQKVMWSYCPECNISTPITVMNEETYYLSLGKFLELSFWAQDVSYFKDCPHDYFKKHIKYFGFNNLVIRIEYQPIDTYEVVVPSKKLDFSLETDIKLKLESLEEMQKSSQSFFRSVSQRLNRVKVDTFDKAEAGGQKIEELKQKLLDQEDFIHSKTMNIYSSKEPTNHLSLNVIKRDLQELGVAWDREFNQFEDDFLPTENEITKITQFHLRNFLMDKLDSDMKEPGTEDPSAPEAETKESADSSGQAQSKSLNGSSTLSEVKDYLNFGSKIRVPLSIIEDKILQFRQSLENDQKLAMRSPGKSRANSITGEGAEGSTQVPNKVQDLTNYFNQMTLEFQRQREQVLERKSNNYKAIPIAQSKPIVEMYDNIEDAVDVYPLQTNSSVPGVASPADSIRKNDESAKPKQQFIGLLPSTSERQLTSTPVPDKKPESSLAKAAKDQGKKLDIPQPEKNSLLKTLTNFWADRSATLWDPLKYPLDFTEHTFADSDVIVREDEPSSLVAFCLSTNDYKEKIIDMAANPNSGDSNDNLENNEQYMKKLSNFTKIERKFKKFAKADNEMSELEATMTKTKSTHLKYQFSDGSTELSCKIFYSEQFEALRKACGASESFVQSLSRCVKWNSKGGKSGSNFLKTLDNKYIVKELSKAELESFVSIAPFYFKYMSQSTFNTLTTAIAKIFGFYQVEIKNSLNGKTFKMDFLIMENLFYDRTTKRIFDLKGSMRNRHVQQTGIENEVLLDENMIEYIYESPVFVREHLKKLLRGSLFNDTAFLSAMDVMDYSLVVGIDDTSHKLYVGIIDWLRTFTWDKKVENWMKGNSLVGKKGKDPTIVTPKQYRTRFREAMDRYILEVPDIWYEGN